MNDAGIEKFPNISFCVTVISFCCIQAVGQVCTLIFMKMNLTIQNEVTAVSVCLQVPLKCYYEIILSVNIGSYILTYKYILLKQQSLLYKEI